MDGFTRGVTRHRRPVIAIFLICAVVCAVLFLGIEVNYDLTDYLPEDAESTVALDLMMKEFGSGVPNTRVMVRKVAPMGDPIELFLRGYELTIRLEDAQKIEITEEKA